MSYREFRGWQEYYKVEPFGEKRADLRAALIACVIANANRGKNSRVFKVEDFMLRFGPPKQQSVEQMKAILKGLAK